MPSVFSRILAGEQPGRIAWQDDRCVALLSATPLRPGHVLLVPREEIDAWVDLPPELASHLVASAQRVGRALRRAFPCVKVALVIAGIQVRHCHVHLVPITSLDELDFSKQDPAPDPAALDEALARLVRELATEP